uniref:C-type lectin domain-containing protein n=1 Tax=Oncorhynchus kisutch TaxID=8019 RepID=A0A8C7J8J8_ONCKI
MEKLAILLLLSASIALGDANLTQLLGLEPLLKTKEGSSSVHSLLEYQFMQALTKDANGHLHSTWLGGFDAIKEGTWMWSDGSRFDYTNWDTDEPNNAGEGEDCLHMNAASAKLWFDVPCEWKFASLCSRRIV